MAKKRPDDLPIIQKAYNTAIYLIPVLERMPRAHRFTLGDRIANAVYDFLELLTVARFTRDKLQMLKEANLLLERLRLLLRLAKDLKAVSIKSYGHATGMMEEVGAMLGGWIRKIKGPRPPRP